MVSLGSVLGVLRLKLIVAEDDERALRPLPKRKNQRRVNGAACTGA
jgi:hypothetical protein